MSSDDQEVEAWYLEGWCFFLMSEQARETGGTIDDLTWQELAKDSRDCLETCRVVCALSALFFLRVIISLQLHANQQHPDTPLLEHVGELIGKLDALGIQMSPTDAPDEGDDGWEDVDDSGASDGDGDVEMQ